MRAIGRFVAVCASALGLSELLAGAWVALNGGMGLGDLVPFLVWLVPFGLMVATAALVLGRATSRWRRGARVGLAAAVGGAAGLLWTLAMAAMMGPWFGTLSFPVLWILIASGALTLGSTALLAR